MNHCAKLNLLLDANGDVSDAGDGAAALTLRLTATTAAAAAAVVAVVAAAADSPASLAPRAGLARPAASSGTNRSSVGAPRSDEGNAELCDSDDSGGGMTALEKKIDNKVGGYLVSFTR